MSKSPVTCHILDSTRGKPVPGVAVRLDKLSDDPARVDAQTAPVVLATGETDSDGRCLALLPAGAGAQLTGGVYRMHFATGAYFAAQNRATFYPFVEITFSLPSSPDPHYHIPLLLSPFSYTTYRGS